MIEVIGWRLDDTVALIRGPADTVVVLDILPVEAGPDGKHKLVSLVRKTINLEQQAAKASVHSIVDGKVTRRIGVITLASFYEDVAARQRGAEDFKSATRDVARLLDGLKREKVESVLIDLRNNGGGSLTEAIDLTGLFIDRGPVVQQRNAQGQISVESDNRAGVAWDGPLAVLIDRSSASASEIFAAAIQDYGRGLIIGEASFGKGTVQTVIDLDQIAKNSKPQFGELKMTIAQFFRVSGDTTQLRGVTPDIVLPSYADAESFGESSFDNALPWTQIKAANYSRAGDLKGLLPVLLALHETRVKNDKDFQYLQEDIAESKVRRKKNLISLNEAERRKELAAEEARLMSREPRKDVGKDASNDAIGKERAPEKGAALRDDGLQPGERKLANELAAEKARKDAKDILLDEAVNILGDEVAVMKTGSGLTARIQRTPVLLLE
jgi:carboxyl-terminal processing protease